MPLFGNLHGALFLDMGNVWNRVDYAEMYDMDPNALTEEDQETWYYLQKWSDEMKFRPSKFFKDIAIGTGIGLRYDLGFLILRLDWGFALHSPYDTGNSGYFSALSFKDRHTLNFAIGYPF